MSFLTIRVLAYVFGRRKDKVFLQLKGLLEPFGITRFYIDGWGAYERHIDPEKHTVGKEHTQKIESKHINLPPGSNGSCVAPSVFPKRRRCTIWCLASSSIARNLGSSSDMESTALKHLPLFQCASRPDAWPSRRPRRAGEPSAPHKG